MDALHGDLEQVKDELLHPENVAKHLGELSRAIATGQEELRYDRFLLYVLADYRCVQQIVKCLCYPIQLQL